MSLIVHDAAADDIAACLSIYAYHVKHGFGTFDETPPSLSEYDAKWRGIVDAGLPFLVAIEGSEVIGFAYASVFRPRPGYRYTVEDSVYIRDDRRGRGVGKALLWPLLERLQGLGVRQVVAVIGDSQNTGSIGLHAKAGFTHSGTMRSVGYKHGRWVDTVMMQKALNGGDGTGPPPQGAWRVPK